MNKGNAHPSRLTGRWAPILHGWESRGLGQDPFGVGFARVQRGSRGVPSGNPSGYCESGQNQVGAATSYHTTCLTSR